MGNAPRGFLSRKKPDFEHVTSKDVAKLAAAAASTKTRLLIRTLWATGARISEVLAIRTQDIDHRGARVLIRRLKRRKKLEQVQPLPRALVDELQVFIRGNKIKGRIFKTNRKTAWRTISDLGRKVLRRSISPKTFRHGMAYRLVKAGKHPLMVSWALGHASMQSTEVYYHPTESDLREALDETY